MDRPTDRDTAAMPSPAPRPPLRRPREDRILAGVAAGIADHLGIDVVIVRILIVVFAVLTEGLGVLAYIAAAIFVPAADPGAPRSTHHRVGDAGGEREPLFWVGIGVLVVGVLWLSFGGGAGSTFFPGGGLRQLVVPLVLIAFGLALWRAGDRRDTAPHGPSVPGPSASYEPSAAAYRPPAATHPSAAQPPAFAASSEPPMTTDTTTSRSSTDPTEELPPPTGGSGGTPPPPPSTGQPYGEPAWTPPPAPEPRERSLLTRFTLGLALVVLGALWSLRVADVIAIGWGTILAGSLLVIGLGLLIGSVVGRARWLILAGALIAPAVVMAQVAPFAHVADGWNVNGASAGEIRTTPADLSELRSEYQLGAGSVRLDLRELDLAGEDVSVRVDVGAGEIRVVTPEDVEVIATGRSGIGQVRLFDARSAGGIGAGEQTVTYTPDGTARGRITLELQAGLGEIRVESGASRSLPSGSLDEGFPDDGTRDDAEDPSAPTETQPSDDPGSPDADAPAATEPEPASSGT